MAEVHTSMHTSTCWRCGHQWTRGKDGSHDCSGVLFAQAVESAAFILGSQEWELQHAAPEVALHLKCPHEFAALLIRAAKIKYPGLNVVDDRTEPQATPAKAGRAKWSADVPKTGGWYWWRPNLETPAVVVHIFYDANQRVMRVDTITGQSVVNGLWSERLHDPNSPSPVT